MDHDVDGSGVLAALPREDGMERLDPRVVPYWLLTGLFSTLVLCCFLGGAALFVHMQFEEHFVLVVTAVSLLGGSSLIWSLISPSLAYARWRYQVDHEVLRMRYGILFHEERSIPISRMQHIDLTRGPIERLFGLATLVVFTAGNEGSAFRVPGLTAARAREIRDQVLQPAAMTSSDGIWGGPPSPERDGGGDGVPDEPRDEIGDEILGDPSDELVDDGEADEQPASGPAPRILAAGHLHPGMLFLRFADGVRQMVFPLVLALVAQSWVLGGIAIAVFVASMGYGLVRFLTFKYELNEEELVTREGILHRQERRIPVNRIQDLSLESTLIRRVFGLVVVSVETASGQGAEARLDSLGRARAEQLREALHLVRRTDAVGEPDGDGPAVVAPTAALPTEYFIFKATTGELMMRGLTNMRLGAILVVFGAGYEFASELGLMGDVGGAVGSLAEWLSRFSVPILIVLLVALAFLVLIAAMVMSVLAMIVLFHGFTLTIRGDVIVRRYGLLTTRVAALPIPKVQRVLLEQNMLRRLFRLVVVRADSAGSGHEREGRGEDRARHRHAHGPGPSRRGHRAVPAAGNGALAAAVAAGLAPRDPAHLHQGPAVDAVPAAPGLVPGGHLGAVRPDPAADRVDRRRPVVPQPGPCPDDAHVGMRWGIVGRYRSIVPFRKVQAVVLRAGPVERLLGLASLTVYVAGGSPTILSNLTRHDAEDLRDLTVAAVERLRERGRRRSSDPVTQSARPRVRTGASRSGLAQRPILRPRFS